ncbi:MAG: GIY-YIG nuclease family protein [Thermoplasmatota archaeon]
MKGIYTLVIELKEDKVIEVGAIGNIDFDKGYYVYVGSAQNGLEARIERHLSDEKKIHWHIDYLLKVSEVIKIFVTDGDKEEECKVADYLNSSIDPIDDFGCSDCKCFSHIFYSENLDNLINLLEQYDGLQEYEVN